MPPSSLWAACTSSCAALLLTGSGRGRAARAGLLFGLATLTRTWALALAGASILALVWRGRLGGGRGAGWTALSLLVVTLALSFAVVRQPGRVPRQSVRLQRPAPKQSFFARRPASFYTSLDVGTVFTHPYAPNYLNHLWPVTYSDWWGDYWRYFDIPYENISTPPQLPRRYEHPRVLQSYVGLLPSLLAGAGLVGLALIGIRRCAPVLLVVAGSVVLLGLQFLVFQIAYPHPDGDTIKATYLLNAVAPLAVCASWALSFVLRAGRLVMISIVLLLAYLAVLDVLFPGAAGVRYVVTGAAGFIGSHLSEALLPDLDQLTLARRRYELETLALLPARRSRLTSRTFPPGSASESSSRRRC